MALGDERGGIADDGDQVDVLRAQDGGYLAPKFLVPAAPPPSMRFTATRRAIAEPRSPLKTEPEPPRPMGVRKSCIAALSLLLAVLESSRQDDDFFVEGELELGFFPVILFI